MTLRTVGVRLMAEVAGYVGGMRTARKETRDFVGELDRAARAGKLDAVADHATAMGIGLAGAFGLAVTAAAKFDKQMSEVSAVSDATGADLERLRQAALDAGADTAFSATQAAQAEAELAKAGLDTSQILGGALTGSLALASAGSLDLAEAADIAAKTMNVFKLKGADVGHIADVLAASANKSATDVHEMGEALRQGGLAANSAGLSLEETVGTLSAFADRALIGSDAGTSLKTMLQMIAAPAGKTADLMQELGIELYDAQGRFVGVERMAGILQERLGGLTEQQRQAAMAQIFGSDATRAATVLYELGEKGIRDYVAAVDDQGAAADVAAKKMDNLAGDVEKLKGSLETMAIEAGSGSSSGLRTLVQTADKLVESISAIPGPVQSGVVILAGLTGATLLAAAGAAKMRAATSRAGEQLAQMGPRGERAARGLERAGRAAGKAATAFVALEVAGAAIASFGDDLNPQVDALALGLEKWGKSGQLAGESARVLGGDLEDLNTGFKFLADTDNTRRNTVRWMQDMFEHAPLFGQALQSTNTSLARTRERVDAMDQALAQLVQGGKADEATAAFNRFAAEQAQFGISVDEVKAKFPAYAAALEVTGKAANGAAGGIGSVGEAAGQSAEEVEKLNTAFDKLFDQYMDLDTATIKYKQGISELKDELTSGARTLDTNTKAGQDNAGAVLEQIDRIKALRDSRIANNETLDVANGKYQKDIEGLRKTLLQLGYNKTAVDELIGKYKAIPDDVNTDITAKDKATSTINAIKAKIISLPDGKTITVAVKYETRGSVPGEHIIGRGTLTKNRWGGVYEHAADGLLRDAGIYSPQGPARYAFAEPATGGELFAPKYGDLDRTRALVGWAVENWWGGWRAFAPQMAAQAGSAGGQRVTNNHYYWQPQRATASMADFAAFQALQDARERVGRPR